MNIVSPWNGGLNGQYFSHYSVVRLRKSSTQFTGVIFTPPLNPPFFKKEEYLFSSPLWEMGARGDFDAFFDSAFLSESIDRSTGNLLLLKIEQFTKKNFILMLLLTIWIG